MITFKDLDISKVYWKWLIKLTTRWRLVSNQIVSVGINKRCDLYGSESCLLSAIAFEWNFHILESIIYQAIDGLMDQGKYVIATNPFRVPKGVEVYNLSMLLEVFSFINYQNKTIARLDALKWVWERETKKVNGEENICL